MLEEKIVIDPITNTGFYAPTDPEKVKQDLHSFGYAFERPPFLLSIKVLSYDRFLWQNINKQR